MKSKGFSLIEVQDMINVVAIIALLAAIAYPMWRDGNMSDFEKQQLHAELERKSQCVAPAFNKGNYTYIATEEQAKWVGRK